MGVVEGSLGEGRPFDGRRNVCHGEHRDCLLMNVCLLLTLYACVLLTSMVCCAGCKALRTSFSCRI